MNTSAYLRVLPRTDPMLCTAQVYCDETIPVEDSALQQLRHAASIDADAYVCATPDIHQGYGVPIGCVFGSEKFILPCAVGYDIHCGMRVLATEKKAATTDIRACAEAIARDVPLGEGKTNIVCDEKTFHAVLKDGMIATERVSRCDARLQKVWDANSDNDDRIRTEDEGVYQGNPTAVSARAHARGITQLGTLGGGNHFIELQEVTDIYDTARAHAWGLFPGQLLVMIHSGSRGLGHQIGGDYMRNAATWCASHGIKTPPGIAYFPADSRDAHDFIGAHNAAANFAYVNRAMVAWLTRYALQQQKDAIGALRTVYDVAHNCVRQEKHFSRTLWVHRKGATRAFTAGRMRGTVFAETGQPVIIPGSMGTASYLLVGAEGNAQTLCSVNHGAGRVMSRTQAAGKKQRGTHVRAAAVTPEALSRAMEGIHLICRDRSAVREEAPMAYKDIDAVIGVVVGAELATPVARMRPRAVLKG